MTEPPQTHRGPVVVIGGGGHAKVVIEVLRADRWPLVGVLDPHIEASDVLGVPVLGGDEQLPALRQAGIGIAFVAVGSNASRLQIGRRIEALGFGLATAVHPSASISLSARLGAGVVVMPQATINAEAQIGDLAIVNTGAIVEHDCVVEEAAHLAPRSVIAGRVRVGAGALFGVGAAARPGAAIGEWATVGAGSVVLGEVAAGAIVAGVPASPLVRRNVAKVRGE
jgi:UDP-perosamine 4-acetyltransferase